MQVGCWEQNNYENLVTLFYLRGLTPLAIGGCECELFGLTARSKIWVPRGDETLKRFSLKN